MNSVQYNMIENYLAHNPKAKLTEVARHFTKEWGRTVTEVEIGRIDVQRMSKTFQRGCLPGRQRSCILTRLPSRVPSRGAKGDHR